MRPADATGSHHPDAIVAGSSLDRAVTGFGIYVHWPFCVSKCPYCDFNSHVRSHVDQARWRAGFKHEVTAQAALLGDHRRFPVTSIFFGGGTPSLMEPATVAAILDSISSVFRLAPDAEITLEANPNSVDAGRFRAYAAAGVNRVSLGIQALNDADLAALGRSHSADEARDAIAIARSAFQRVSIDLIYAREGQTPERWLTELDEAIALGTDHLSVYQLTIEPGTAFATRHARGDLVLPEPETQAVLFERTNARLAEHGLDRYEVSNHARPGQQSRHNLVYWHYDPYLGIGPGAHGRIWTPAGQVLATRSHAAPEVWLDRVEADASPLRTQTIAPAERMVEMLMMGLRISDGVDLSRLATITGAPLDHWVTPDRVAALVEEGLLTVTPNGRLSATPSGVLRLNGVLDYLLG